MLWSNSAGDVIKSVKYNIFKTVVNSVNLGNYVPSEATTSNITPTAMISKDRKKMCIALYNNTSTYYKSVTVRLPIKYDPTSIEYLYWTADVSREGVSNILDENVINGNTFTVDLPPYSVGISLVKIEESDEMVDLDDFEEGGSVW